MTIDPAARIHPTAEIDPSATISAGVTIEEGVKIGAGCHLMPNVYIGASTHIGCENEFHMGAVIGHAPQDLTYDGTPTRTVIGDRNIFREGVTVHRASRPDGETRIGNDCLLMVGAHVAHDCKIGDSVILTNCCALGGHVRVDTGSFLSGTVLVHQFVRIGRLSMVAPLSTVMQDFPPFSLGGGRRALVNGINVVGLRRAGIAPAARARISRDQRTLYRAGLTVSEALEVLREEPSPETRELISFVEDSRRGITRFGAAIRETADTTSLQE